MTWANMAWCKEALFISPIPLGIKFFLNPIVAELRHLACA